MIDAASSFARFGWWRRRWTDIRNGIDHYIAKVLAFVSFILVIRLNYPELFAYTPLVVLGLIILAGGSGFLHRIFQWGTDNNSAFEQAPLSAKIEMTLFKAVLGTASKEEIAWAMDKLKTISEAKG